MAQDWTSFTVSIAVKSTLNTIYNAWTKSSEIEKWFLETCSFIDANGKTIESTSNVEPDNEYE